MLVSSKPSLRILVIDVGGTHIKCLYSGSRKPRRFKSGPGMTAAKMVRRVLEITRDWQYEAVSIGYPGRIVHGRPVHEPYNLGGGWAGFHFERAFRCPVKIINDAAMQAWGAYRGGRMLFLGLGTGLGSALILEGIMEAMELAHLPYKKGRTYEDYLGKRGLRRLGKKRWRKEVLKAVARLGAAFEIDYVLIGGGNAAKLKRLPEHVRIGDNADAFRGGFRLWDVRWTSRGFKHVAHG